MVYAALYMACMFSAKSGDVLGAWPGSMAPSIMMKLIGGTSTISTFLAEGAYRYFKSFFRFNFSTIYSPSNEYRLTIACAQTHVTIREHNYIPNGLTNKKNLPAGRLDGKSANYLLPRLFTLPRPLTSRLTFGEP